MDIDQLLDVMLDAAGGDTHQLLEAALDAVLLTDAAKDLEHPELPPSLTTWILNMQKQYPQVDAKPLLAYALSKEHWA